MILFMSNMTDGEHSFIEQLYGTYKNKVFTIALAILKNKEDAEDAVCETFMRIIKDRKYFSGRKREDVSRLIVKYSRWTSINLYNKRKRDISVHEDGDGDTDILLTVPDTEALTENIAESRDMKAAVRRALDSLSSKYRDVLIMQYYDEMKISDIASLLGISESAVNMRIMRAKEKIKEMLDGEGYTNE